MIGELASDLFRRWRRRADFQRTATLLLVFPIAWLLGKAVADHSTLLVLIFVVSPIAYLVFFHRRSVLWLAPIAMCVPNFGLDIPGQWAVSIEDAFVMIAFIALVLRAVMTRGRIFPFDVPILKPLLVFLAVAVISVGKVALYSPANVMFITKDLMRLTMLALFYVIMTDAVRTKENVLTVIRTLLAISIFMAVISWYIYLTKSPFFYEILTMKPAYIYYKGNILRMISIMGSTSFSGLYFATLLALAMTHPLRVAGRRFPMPNWLLAGLLFSCLVMTFNRGTWVGVLLGVVFLMFLGRLSWKKIMIAILLGIGLVILVSTHFFAQFDVEHKINILIEISRSSGSARLVRWLSAVNVMTDQPLLGVGYNNYAYLYGKYSIEQGVIPTYGSPHNMYVDIITGTGFIGLAVFIFFLVRLWKLHAENLRATKDPELKNTVLGLFLVLTFFLGASGFDSFLFKPHHTSFVIFLLWALSSSIWRINREQAASEKAAAQANSAPAGEAVRQ
jgi:O-antigen ligase